MSPPLEEGPFPCRYLGGVAANIATRAPASSEIGLGIDVGTIGQAKSDAGVLGAHAVHLEVGRSSLDDVHVVYHKR